jgi:hypothetical protein
VKRIYDWRVLKRETLISHAVTSDLCSSSRRECSVCSNSSDRVSARSSDFIAGRSLMVACSPFFIIPRMCLAVDTRWEKNIRLQKQFHPPS